jgi:hypothetical protein
MIFLIGSFSAYKDFCHRWCLAPECTKYVYSVFHIEGYRGGIALRLHDWDKTDIAKHARGIGALLQEQGILEVAEVTDHGCR